MVRVLALLASLLSATLLATPPAAWPAVPSWPAARSSPAAPSWPAGRPPADLTGRLALDNGFEAFVLPRPGAPLVALLVAIKAGSRYETPATRGAAHLLEHLVFEGTAARGRDEIFRWVYGIGGYLNGFTREDFTGYILMGPPGELPAMARLLAELLSGARLSTEALDGVKAVVLEELRQAQADPSYQDEVAFRAALFHGTPYAEPPLGTEATIRAITLDELAGFYRQRYGPGNMVALAIGGAGASEMADALRAAFGPLRAPGEASPRGSPAQAPRLTRAGAVVRAGRQPALRLGLLGPAPSDPVFADFLALGDLLAGPASPLPAALAAVGGPEGLQPNAEAEFEGGLATLEVRTALPQGVDPDRALAALVAALARLAATEAPADAPVAITAAVVARGARHARLEAARLAERLHYFAMAQAPLLAAGRPDLALGGPAAADPAAVRSALARALAGGWVALLPASAGAPAAAPPGATGPPRREARLANGLTVAAETRTGSPLVAAHLLAGGRLLAEPPGLAGAAEVLHRLLLRGPAGTSEPLETRLAALGATISVADDPREPFGDFYFARDFSGIRLEALAEEAEAALRLLADAVASPPFDAKSVGAARDDVARLAAWRSETPRTLAEDRLWGRLFDGPFGAPPAGSPESLARATPEALAAFHRRYFAPGNLVLTIVGDEPPERLVALAEATFGRLKPGPGASHWSSAGAASAAEGGAPLRLKLALPQGQVRVGLVLPAGDAREQAALSIAVGLLGASLFRSLRDEQGLAYSVGAEVTFVGPHAVVTAGLGTRPAEVNRALAEVRRLVAARAGAPVSPEDVARRAKAIAGRLASRQLSSATRAYYLGAAVHAGAPHRFGDDYAALLASITPAEVEAAQRRAFSLPLAAVVVE
jgi:zinc protease